MFQLEIHEKGGSSRQESFEKNEITIGRVQGNDVILAKGNISKRHSRIVLRDGKFIIVDLKSTNGTYVNGKKITAPQVIKATDKIYIGDFTIQLSANGEAKARRDDEIDLFVGDDAIGGDESGGMPPPSRAKAPGTPGLIDDNFDQEFDAPDPPQPKLPKPRRKPEPEPEPAEPDFDDGALDFDNFSDAMSDAPEPEPEPELDLAPEPPAAPSTRRPSPVPAEPAPALALAPPPPEPAAPTALPTAAPSSIAVAGPSGPGLDRAAAIRTIHRTVVGQLGMRGMEISALPAQRDRVRATAHAIAKAMSSSGRVDGSVEPGALADAVAERATDLSLILDYIQDEEVLEIAVTHDRQVLVDRDGSLKSADRMISSEDQLVDLLMCFGVLGGEDPGPDKPLVDVRLRNGDRVVGALPPVAFRGPTFSYRKTTRDHFTLEQLFEYSTLSKAMFDFITYCVRYRANVLLSTGPGVSPTATLNALLHHMPTDDRIVTIENGVELHMGGEHKYATCFEPHADDDIAALINHARILQADRLVLGNLAPDFALEAVSAVASSLDGSVVGISAGSPREAVDRLVNVELGDSLEGKEQQAKRLVARAFPVVIQERKFDVGSRRITAISEVFLDGDELVVEDIFRFKPEGLDKDLLVVGSFEATGHTPKFLEELVQRGEADNINMEIFEA